MEIEYKYYWNIKGNKVPVHIPKIVVDSEVMKEATQVFLGQNNKEKKSNV